MKSRVELSTYSSVVTFLIFGVLIGCIIIGWRQSVISGIIGCSLVVILMIVSLIYAPLSVVLDDKGVNINSSFKVRAIPYGDIASVELFQPTMGARRILGSGGFMGYWGLFREGDIGKYTAYYGKASDCFMLTLRDGRKYVLGCKNPDKISAEIAARISCR